jgi:hypothetical protein
MDDPLYYAKLNLERLQAWLSQNRDPLMRPHVRAVVLTALEVVERLEHERKDGRFVDDNDGG